jgi:prevent-host-death family protein
VRTELVTTLKRKATEILSQPENEKAPILITQHGRPAAYLVDIETYDELQRRLAGKPPSSSYDDVLRLLAKHCDIVDEIFTAPNGVVI